jgi:hypothetical protein
MTRNRKPAVKRDWSDVSGHTVGDYERAGVPADVLLASMKVAHGNNVGSAKFLEMGGSIASHKPAAALVESAAKFSQFHIKN